MADFYSHNWNPVRHGYNPLIRTFSSKPKVVNVPVNFVSSDDASLKKPPAPTTVSSAADRMAAAVSIQKVVRGFLVRLNVRAVRQIAMEVDEIERKVRDAEVKISVDMKARLRVSEELMALLLRLDSVRWVRDLRKKMIRRVMGLQEMIDSISAAVDGNSSTINIPKDSAGESVEEPSIYQTVELHESNESGMELEIAIPASDSQSIVTEDHEESINGTMKSDGLNLGDHSCDPEVEMGMEMENRAVVESINMEIGEEGGSPEADVSRVEEPSEELRGLKEIMERMAAENDTLKMMVSRLCETSAEQCRLMEGLAGRVSNLERVVHRMDRRKKSKSSTARR